MIDTMTKDELKDRIAKLRQDMAEIDAQLLATQADDGHWDADTREWYFRARTARKFKALEYNAACRQLGDIREQEKRENIERSAKNNKTDFNANIETSPEFKDGYMAGYRSAKAMYVAIRNELLEEAAEVCETQAECFPASSSEAKELTNCARLLRLRKISN